MKITVDAWGQADFEGSEAMLRRLSRHLLEARESERTNLAREIHDELGAALTGLKMLVDRLPDHRGADDGFRNILNQLRSRIDETMENVRRIVTRLRPPILDELGLATAVAWQARTFGERSGLRCRVSVPRVDPGVTGERATVLFRILQELLTNVARHAQASEVRIRLVKRRNGIVLTVFDNGRGIAPDRTTSPDALGLLGIRERLSPWKGDFRIAASPAGGTLAEVRLPLGRESE